MKDRLTWFRVFQLKEMSSLFEPQITVSDRYLIYLSIALPTLWPRNVRPMRMLSAEFGIILLFPVL